jgi:AraC-like DNA-binding protein
MDNYRLAFLMPFSKAPADEAIRSYFAILKKSVLRAFKFTVSIGVSRPFSSIESAGGAYIEAAKALSFRFFSGADSINFYDERAETDCTPEAGEPLDAYRMILLAESMVDTVSGNDADRISESVDELTNKLAEMCKSDEALFRSAVLCVVMLCLKLLFKENRRQLALILKKYSCFKQIVSNGALSDIRDMLTSLIIDLGDYASVKGNINRKAILNRVSGYIEEHYAEEISLSSLAQAVYLSPSYLSTLISTETGKSFVDILNQYRVKKSIELLRASSLKNYMIASQVGYKEAQYFSYIFKKYTGVTPTKYRQLYLSPDNAPSSEDAERPCDR